MIQSHFVKKLTKIRLKTTIQCLFILIYGNFKFLYLVLYFIGDFPHIEFGAQANFFYKSLFFMIRLGQAK